MLASLNVHAKTGPPPATAQWQHLSLHNTRSIILIEINQPEGNIKRCVTRYALAGRQSPRDGLVPSTHYISIYIFLAALAVIAAASSNTGLPRHRTQAIVFKSAMSRAARPTLE